MISKTHEKRALINPVSVGQLSQDKCITIKIYWGQKKSNRRKKRSENNIWKLLKEMGILNQS